MTNEFLQLQIQKMKSSELSKLREIIDQQKKMLEANQNLTQQPMQRCIQTNRMEVIKVAIHQAVNEGQYMQIGKPKSNEIQ